MPQVLTLVYNSGLTRVVEKNTSFDVAVLKIAYEGLNRNGSSISKEVFERAIPSIYNTPVVTNYDRETESLGGHDMDVVKTSSGGVKIVNATHPVGVIPESANVWWETFEVDGQEKDYLCTDVLVWKRQEAYDKLYTDKSIAQSMEITVKEGHLKDGVYEILSFEFTAFCLIGVEPCFENSELTFSVSGIKDEIANMMSDLKDSYSKTLSNPETVANIKEDFLKEGGSKVLSDKKMELIEKYEMNADDFDLSEDISIEDFEEKLKAFASKKTEEGEVKDAAEGADEGKSFELASNINAWIREAVSGVRETVEGGWERSKYYVADTDILEQAVYLADWDGHFYKAPYSMDGDVVVVDFDAKVRVKLTYVEFVEGSEESFNLEVFQHISDAKREVFELTKKYQTVSDKVNALEEELSGLRAFKKEAEEAELSATIEAVFSEFEDLVGNEDFENLKENARNYDVNTLEEKCYAIRGKSVMFSRDEAIDKAPKITVLKEAHDGHESDHNEPYGGLFKKFSSIKSE